VLGAVWSLLNPLVYLAVFSFVAKVLGAGIPNYPVYLLSGLLAWNLFSASMGPGARAVLDNANLVKKVAFAREILPLSAVGVGLVDFALQSACCCSTSSCRATASTCPSSRSGRSPS
jgi:ABC-type polysaccharide/polyol phosphate export permease